MHKIKKCFINSKLRDEKNLRQTKKLLKVIDLKNVRDALDIGCGDGTISAFLSNNYPMKVIGIDVDSEQIIAAKKKFEMNDNLVFLETDAIELPFEDNKFDMILTLNVFHHIGNWKKTLEEINRLLKPDGYFIFTGFTYSGFVTKFYRKLNEKFDVFTFNEINNFLTTNNFKAITINKPNTAMPIGGLKFRYYRCIFHKL